jgi:hypothetical protein
MIINIEPHNFGGPMRNGDLIALMNFIEYLWKDNKELQFHVPDRSIQPNDYIRRFRDWLVDNTNHFVKTEGQNVLNIQNANLWELRSMTGDILKLDFAKPTKKKIVIAPLFDGPYNTYRNWPKQMADDIIEHYSQKEYDDYEKVICVKDWFSSVSGWSCSHDFIKNIEHIIECSHFVGGDTGTSHFASVLPQKEKLNYFYGSVGLLHTTPFYALQGKGNINMFNQQWKLDLL